MLRTLASRNTIKMKNSRSSFRHSLKGQIIVGLISLSGVKQELYGTEQGEKVKNSYMVTIQSVLFNEKPSIELE